MQLGKPVIFFSHSSRDRDSILPIRNRLLEGTGNSVDVFMSSDGASIPFGRNWLKEIETALGQSKLMFVWITPASLKSTWLLFESGFAYSKGIRVVPIGFQGVRLEDLPAPMSILQGFNVLGPASLNNIVAIINDEFKLTFPDLYDDKFYETNVEDVTSEDSPELLRFIKVIECELWQSVSLDDGKKAHLSSNWFERLKNILKELDTNFAEQSGELFGIGFRVMKTGSNNADHPFIRVDPLALNATRQVWATARERLYDRELPYTCFEVNLATGLGLPDDESLIGSRLLNSEVSFETEMPYVLYGFRNIVFRIANKHLGYGSEQMRLVLLEPQDNRAPLPLLSLLRLLEERNIIRAQ